MSNTVGKLKSILTWFSRPTWKTGKRINLLRQDPELAGLKARRNLIDVGSLNEKGITGLKSLLSYRNAETGAGVYWSGTYDKYKVRVGFRQRLFYGLEMLKRSLADYECLPLSALEIFSKANNNITMFELKIQNETQPAVEKAVDAVFSRHQLVPDQEIVTDQHPHQSEFSQVIIKSEGITLDYLRLIDGEIDTILGLFGLSRHSEI